MRKIGAGGMGVVFEANDLALGRRVALKALPALVTSSAYRRDLLASEARHLAGVSSRHVVALHELLTCDDVPYLVMEYVEPGSLESLLKRLADTPIRARGGDVFGAPYEERDYIRACTRLLIDVLRGLEAVHAAGLVHRDLKPGNVLLDSQAGAKIADFGLVKNLDQGDLLSSVGMVRGTPSYMSPEQAAGNWIGLDHRTDIFSAGVVLYEMLTGKRPFAGDSRERIMRAIVTGVPVSLRRLNRRVPRDLARVVERALEKDYERRYPDALSMREDLERTLRHEPLEGGRVSPRDRVRRFLFGQSPLAVVGAAFLVCGLPLELGVRWLSGERLTSRALLFRTCDMSHPEWMESWSLASYGVASSCLFVGSLLVLGGLVHRGRRRSLGALSVSAATLAWLAVALSPRPNWDQLSVPECDPRTWFEPGGARDRLADLHPAWREGDHPGMHLLAACAWLALGDLDRAVEAVHEARDHQRSTGEDCPGCQNWELLVFLECGRVQEAHAVARAIRSRDAATLPIDARERWFHHEFLGGPTAFSGALVQPKNTHGLGSALLIAEALAGDAESCRSVAIELSLSQESATGESRPWPIQADFALLLFGADESGAEAFPLPIWTPGRRPYVTVASARAERAEIREASRGDLDGWAEDLAPGELLRAFAASPDEARTLLDALRPSGRLTCPAHLLGDVAALAWRAGDAAFAIETAQAALHRVRAGVDWTIGAVLAREVLGLAAAAGGDLDEAAQHLRRALHASPAGGTGLRLARELSAITGAALDDPAIEDVAMRRLMLLADERDP